MANEFKVRKGLVVNGSGSVLLDIQGSQGQLFSVTDQLSGSLFSVSDISGIPVMEAFSDNTVKIGKYGSEAIKVSGSVASITGSFSGSFSGSFFGSGSQSTSASYAYTASSAISSSFATFAYSASFAPGFSVSMSQATPALTWSFTHNLNSRNPVVQVYDTTYAQIIPNQIVGMNNSTAEIRFDYAQAGYAVFSNGGGLYVTGSTSTLVQTVGAATWSFTHNLNNKYNTYEVYDNNDYVLIPSAIKAVDNNSAELYFSGLQTGRAIAQFSGINGAPNATTASYALTASFILPLSQSVSINGFTSFYGNISGSQPANNPSSSLILISGSILPASGSTSGSSAIYVNTVMSASANNQTLVGLDINPTFNNGAFTGLSNFPLRVNARNVAGNTFVNFTTGVSANDFTILSTNQFGFTNRTGTTATGTAGAAAWGLWDGTRINGFFGHAGSNTNLGFSIGGAQVGTWFATGNLFVGSSPTDAGYRLDVSGSARVQGSLGNIYTNSSGNELHFSRAGASYILSDTSAFGIYTNSVLGFYQSTSGNVGINTTTDAGFRLDVSGSTRITNNLTVSGSTQITGSGTTNSTLDITGIQANSAVNPPKGTISLYYDGVDGATAGVYGASVIFSQRYNAVTATPIAIGMIAGVKVNSGGNFGGGLTFWTSDETLNNLAERARIDVSGRMAIGHKSPTALLHISGSGSGSLFQISSHVSSSIFFVSGSGNVGINTATPSVPLSFGSDVGNKIALYDAGSTTTIYGFGIQSSLLQIFANTSTNRVGIGYGNSTSFTETLTVKGLNVGINKTSPSASLDVSGSTLITGSFISSGSTQAFFGNLGLGTTTPSGALHINSNNYNTATSTSIFITDHGNNTNDGNEAARIQFQSRYWGSDDMINAVQSAIVHGKNAGNGNGGSFLAFHTTTRNSANIFERVRISSDGVGINKVSPSASLDVSGSMLVTGSLAMSGSFTQVGYKILTTVSQSLNYSDDTAAAAGGIPLGGLYRNGNFILIRLS